MPEYIEREALVSEIEANINTYWNEAHGGYYLAEDALNDSVKVAPAVDVVEVRHGEWVEAYGARVSCSVCDPDREDDQPGYFKFMNYCPNCGAKMK